MSTDTVTPILRQPASVQAPINPLCRNGSPTDTITACQQFTQFLQLTQNLHLPSEGDDEKFQTGMGWSLAMLHDALGYAGELVTASSSASRCHIPR